MVNKRMDELLCILYFTCVIVKLWSWNKIFFSVKKRSISHEVKLYYSWIEFICISKYFSVEYVIKFKVDAIANIVQFFAVLRNFVAFIRVQGGRNNEKIKNL